MLLVGDMMLFYIFDLSHDSYDSDTLVLPSTNISKTSCSSFKVQTLAALDTSWMSSSGFKAIALEGVGSKFVASLSADSASCLPPIFFEFTFDSPQSHRHRKEPSEFSSRRRGSASSATLSNGTLDIIEVESITGSWSGVFDS